MPSFKILDNIPYQVKFLYDTPKVWDNTDDQGKAYKTYSYGVEINQKNEYLGVSEAVHNMLQSFGPLSARTLEIAKVQDPGDLKKKHWVFKENGVELRPTQSNVPTQVQNAPTGQISANPATCNCTEKWNKIRVWAESVQKQLTELKRLETLVVELKGESAVKLHSSIKSPTIEESKAPSIENAAAIVDSYKSDPSIPTVETDESGFPKV